MARLERARIGRNVEQLGEEVFEHRRELDDQLGLRLARGLVTSAFMRVFQRATSASTRVLRRAICSPCRHQPVMQIGVALLQHVDEAAVETRQAVAAIEVHQLQVEGKAQAFGHLTRSSIDTLASSYACSAQAAT